jgi:hypothetical protein
VTGHPYSRRAKTALIVSTDALGAALLGAATELAGFRVAYLGETENAADGIRRVKPLTVLVDATHPIATDAASLGPALMTGAAVVFYGQADRLRDVRVVAATAHASVIALPEELDRLPGILTSIAARQPGRPVSE